MAAWDRVTCAHVLRAVEEYDRPGAEGFFSARGFGPPRSCELVIGGSRYPSKAILGAAYEVATGQRLGSGDFEGGKGGAVSVPERLGFEVEAIQRQGTLAEDLVMPRTERPVLLAIVRRLRARAAVLSAEPLARRACVRSAEARFWPLLRSRALQEPG